MAIDANSEMTDCAGEPADGDGEEGSEAGELDRALKGDGEDAHCVDSG